MNVQPITKNDGRRWLQTPASWASSLIVPGLCPFPAKDCTSPSIPRSGSGADAPGSAAETQPDGASGKTPTGEPRTIPDQTSRTGAAGVRPLHP